MIRPTPETATNLFTNLFFNPERYDLSKVGRLKLNFKFGLEEPLDEPDPHQARHPRGHPLPDRPEERQGDDRRHRPPRQPPRPRGGRAAREPVPHRSRPHGAGDQGAHEPPGDRDAHAARPDQRQAGDGGDQGVLRLQPAVAVHGPDEPAVRGHAQAAPVGPRARRPDPRARRLRGARRAPDALRPHLPHRDAGRSEHRPHRVAVDLSPASTSSASSRRRTARSRAASVHRRDVAFYSALEEEKHTIAQANAEFDKKGKFVNDARVLPPRR